MSKTKNDFLEKYSRQIIIDQIGMEGQKKISNSSVTIIGCGGLGTSAAQYLSMSGIGGFTLIDDDNIDISNLNRQTLFTEEDLGQNKSYILSKKIKKINNSSNIFSFNEKVTSRNITKLANKNLMILDCTDNFESRLLINQFCHQKKKILISVALQNFDIQASILASWKLKSNPCYKCIFPSLVDDKNTSCDEMGVIASVAGLGGVMQANIALNYILGFETNFNEFILFDCINLNLRKIKVKKNPRCKICSK